MKEILRSIVTVDISTVQQLILRHVQQTFYIPVPPSVIKTKMSHDAHTPIKYYLLFSSGDCVMVSLPISVSILDPLIFII